MSFTIGGRDVEQASCSCGGQVQEVDTTEAEEKRLGCGRAGCCLRAMACQKCGTRWLLRMAAPEME